MTNWFATQWPDAWAAAKETLERLPDLTARTRAFHDALFDSTLPRQVLDAVSSQMSIIRTTTCLRTATAASTPSRAATTTPAAAR